MILPIEIKCVVQDTNGTITHVGVFKSKYTVQNIVEDIRKNLFQYYTYKAGNYASVYAKQHPTFGRWFLTIDPDDTNENNLDFLPKCL